MQTCAAIVDFLLAICRPEVCGGQVGDVLAAAAGDRVAVTQARKRLSDLCDAALQRVGEEKSGHGHPNKHKYAYTPYTTVLFVLCGLYMLQGAL